ncbi:CMP-N-acetylneuraminate-poly-alpha-2,8-sialyltransferase-like isoform X1 [Diadema antillarum]|uniref:CMP-N-acetylneuraminate-poly-alpha-2, 8-sialyltransferase-like isoform X1 n=1 Tax=Diadema antillarum TaxID=105358 RepID=UPI003A847496
MKHQEPSFRGQNKDYCYSLTDTIKMNEIGFKLVMFLGTVATTTTTIYISLTGDSRYHQLTDISYSEVSLRELLPNTSLFRRACTFGIKDDRQMDDYLPQLVIYGTDIPAEAPSRSDHNLINGPFTKNLWSFNEPMSEQIYMYEQTLQKKWLRNSTNVEKFRLELANYHEALRGKHKIIASKENVQVNTSMHSFRGSAKLVVTPEVYKVLPEKNPLPESGNYHSCAVVGNSGSLLGSGCGQEIDSHDFVIRCNLASIPPFKHDAGTQTNLTTMNPSILRTRYGKLKTRYAKQKLRKDLSMFDGTIWVPGSLQNALVVHNTMGGIKNPQIITPYPEHFRYVSQFWKDRSFKRWLSSGFYLATLAVQLCDDISLYGFWPFSYRFEDNQKVRLKYHYFDKTTDRGARAHHAMDREFSILLQLHHAGVLRLHVGRCESRDRQ